jgi:hypothetical protein
MTHFSPNSVAGCISNVESSVGGNFELRQTVVCRLTSGAFTIDSSAPTLRIHLNEHPIIYYLFFRSNITVSARV